MNTNQILKWIAADKIRLAAVSAAIALLVGVLVGRQTIDAMPTDFKDYEVVPQLILREVSAEKIAGLTFEDWDLMPFRERLGMCQGFFHRWHPKATAEVVENNAAILYDDLAKRSGNKKKLLDEALHEAFQQHMRERRETWIKDRLYAD